MVKKLGPRAASVTIEELGVNCWLPRRFIEGERCCRVMDCTYPEKKTCRAVDAEIDWLLKEQEIQYRASSEKIAQLVAYKK